MGWIDAARLCPVPEVAASLGFEPHANPSSSTCACPACGAQTRHVSRGDRRGAVGIPHRSPTGWRCHDCGAGGDAVDFVSWRLHGARFAALSKPDQIDVRNWFSGRGHVEALPSPSPIVPAAPVYPPGREVGALWGSVVDVLDDADALAWLAHREIDAAALSSLKLCGVLPQECALPAWARCGTRTWLETGHRLLVPLFDAQGTPRSVLARCVDMARHVSVPKSIAPVGYARAGLVLANDAAVRMLQTGAAEGSGGPVVIREGEVDWMWTCIRYAGPVFGVVSGSWTPAHAARVPDGVRVVVATDADEAGDAYAHQIAATFKGRNVRLTRDRRAA